MNFKGYDKKKKQNTHLMIQLHKKKIAMYKGT